MVTRWISHKERINVENDLNVLISLSFSSESTAFLFYNLSSPCILRGLHLTILSNQQADFLLLTPLSGKTNSFHCSHSAKYLGKITGRVTIGNGWQWYFGCHLSLSNQTFLTRLAFYSSLSRNCFYTKIITFHGKSRHEHKELLRFAEAD